MCGFLESSHLAISLSCVTSSRNELRAGQPSGDMDAGQSA